MFTVAWVLIALSLIGMAAVVISKLPNVVLVKPTHRGRLIVVADNLVDYFWHKFKQLGNYVWRFILEAKDIRPSAKLPAQVGDKVKKVFKIRIRESEKDPAWLPEVAEDGVRTPEPVQPAVTPERQSSSNPVKKDVKTAEELYLRTIQKDPNNRQAYEGLGRLYLQDKNFTEAAETFKFLTTFDPQRDVYWSNLGISQYSLKDFQSATASYEQALKINNKVPARWINLALCFEAMDEHNRAVRAINKALELDPRNSNYLMLLADIYLKISNQIRAEEVLTQVLALDPTNKTARERLMKIKI
jgi:tetratricopeptide (TPR) repeat protein